MGDRGTQAAPIINWESKQVSIVPNPDTVLGVRKISRYVSYPCFGDRNHAMSIRRACRLRHQSKGQNR